MEDPALTDPIAADCRTTYKAAHHDGRRQPADIRWIILHDEEASTAVSAAAWFANPDSEGSAHLCIDDTTCYRTLPNNIIPWGAASAFGANTHGFHIEQAGFARWSAVIWKSHLATLRRAAYKTAFHCHKFGVPPVFVTAADLPAKNGITTHAEITSTSKRLDPGHTDRYTHTDPGLFWPRRLFMALVQHYYKEIG